MNPRTARAGSPKRSSFPRDEQGIALITVMVFALVVTLMGFAYFAMASYETKGALYRERSSEAFFLADGGIERARGEFIEDLAWRGPVDSTDMGTGSYRVTAEESSWNGLTEIDEMPILKLHSEGRAKNAKRAVDTWVTVPSIIQSRLMIVMNEIDAGGNFCLDGTIHANVDADFGPNDVHLKCGGEYTEGFALKPPKIYTEPARYNNCTYYYVVPNTMLLPGEPIHAKIFDRFWNDITVAVDGDAYGLEELMSVSAGKFRYGFKPGDVQTWFDFAAGKFRLAPGDSSVVVNFGEPYVAFPSALSDIELQQNPGDASIRTTIINTRFTGASEDQRLDSKFWTGGWCYFKTATTFEPAAGIALICHDFDQGNAQATFGTPANPALLYVTHDVDDVQGGFTVNGAVIVLHDWESTGGPNLTYDPDFIQKIPSDMNFTHGPGTSGVMYVLEWREVAAGS